MTFLPTSAGDLRDQRWLDAQIENIEVGVEAVVNIARNWSEGRNLARLHPGVSAAEYVTERVGVLGKAVVPVLLAESNWSSRQIAAVAGVHSTTVDRVAARTAANAAVAEPRETLGADGKVRAYPPRVVEAVVIDEPMPAPKQPNMKVTNAAFARDIARIREGYAPYRYNPKFAYGEVLTAIDAALED